MNRWSTAYTRFRESPLEVVGAGWWIVPVVLVASLGSAAYLTAGDEAPSYQAAATFTVGPSASLANENQMLRALEVLERRTTLVTLSRISTSEVVRRRAATRIQVSPRDLGDYEIRGSLLPSTHMLRVSVSGPDPDRVEQLAIAVADVTEAEAEAAYPVFDLQFVDAVDPPSGPLESGEGRTWVVAGVLGLFLGLGAAYGVGVLRSTRVERFVAEDAGPARLKTEKS